MAEGKKSFIAYASWKGIFDELPDLEAGALIKHIFAYVNDENPQTDSILIKAVFANIKTTLKTDLKKWEAQIKQRSEAGKKSVEARKRTNVEQSLFPVNERSARLTVNGIGTVTVTGTVTEYTTPAAMMKKHKEQYLQQLEMKNSKIDFAFALEQWSLSIESKEDFIHTETDAQVNALWASLTKWMNSWSKNERNWKTEKQTKKHGRISEDAARKFLAE